VTRTGEALEAIITRIGNVRSLVASIASDRRPIGQRQEGL
jgi:hypothetical protein